MYNIFIVNKINKKNEKFQIKLKFFVLGSLFFFNSIILTLQKLFYQYIILEYQMDIALN